MEKDNKDTKEKNLAEIVKKSKLKMSDVKKMMF